MKKKFTFLFGALCALMIMISLPGKAVGQTRAEVVYKQTIFNSTNNSGNTNSYSNSWTNTTSGFTVNIANANNNNNNWNYIKIGGKNGAYTGKLTTNSVIDEPVTKVVLTIDAIDYPSNLTSMKLYSSSNNSTWTEIGTFDKSVGAKEVTVNTPTANLYYKIEVVCTKASKNGVVAISKVEYYHNAGSTTYTVTYNANNGTASPSTFVDNNSGYGYEAGAIVAVLDNNPNDNNTPSFTKTGYSFSHWNTAANGSGTPYNPNDDESNTISITENVNLYAQWYTNVHNVNMPTEDTYGTYTATSSAQSGNFEYGSTITLNYAPVSGYENYVATWTMNDAPLAGNTFIMPDADVTIGVSVAPYVQPKEIEIIPNYTFWGKDSSFSGNTNPDMEVNKDNVSLEWESNGGNMYANQNAMRFYSKNTLTFTAPTGYEIQRIEFSATYSTFTSSSLTFSPTGFDGSTNIWTGSSNSVTMSGPSSGSGYAQFSNITITLGKIYDIDYASLTNGSFASGNPTSAIEGASVTVNTTPATNYHLASMNYNDGTDDHTITISGTSGTFTMPATGVTVSATFAQDASCTITFNENGTTNEYPVTSGPIDADLLTDHFENVPANLTFVGWSTSEIASYETSEPNGLIDETYNVEDDVLLYAVYKYDYSYTTGGSTPTWTKVTDASTLSVGDQLVIANDENGKVAGDINSTKKLLTTTPASFSNDIMTDLNNDAIVFTLGGSIGAWTLNNENNVLAATTAKSLVWYNNTGTATWTIGINGTNATITSTNDDYGSIQYNYNNGEDRFLNYTSNQSPIQLYRLEGVGTTVSGSYYLTSVEEIAEATTISSTTDLSNNVTVNQTTGSYTLNSILNAKGYLIINEAAGKIIVNNNGQLIADNAVAATVKKSITGYGDNDDVQTGWNFIASPLAASFAPTSNMTSNNYDLYRLNPNPSTGLEWENYENQEHTAGFTIDNGRGYLYANSNDVTLEFAGTIKPYDEEYTIEVTKGWNLVGNPYTFDAYVSVPYYAMNNDGSGITTTVATSTAVKPCTGIVIKADNNGTVKFSDTPPVGSANNGNLQMVLAHKVATRDGASVNKNIDNAIVSFNEGSQLEKFYFGNPSASIFIPQNGEDYAIAFSDRQGDVPLYFKANETGTYTISFAGDEMSLNGIYLIDILAEEEIDLSVNPSYTFIGSPADRMARFKIVFRNTGGDGTSDIFAYQNGNDIIVSGEGELQIFDVMGRMVSRQRVNGVETVNAMPYGVYIFKLNGMTQKIVVR